MDIIANNLQNGNCAKLQNTLNGIAFCDPESEFPETSQMPPEMLKVFKIAQLTIQYLLHSQDMLTDGIKKLKNDNYATNHVSQICLSFFCSPFMYRRGNLERTKPLFWSIISSLPN